MSDRWIPVGERLPLDISRVWVVGDGWGQHHPGCPCGNKAEVEAP